MRMCYKKFRKGVLKTWDSVFEEACAFASEIGKDKVVSLSQSSDAADSFVIVWYWDEK